jgi:MFS family permease
MIKASAVKKIPESHRALSAWVSRLPFYYGWVLIGIAFITIAIGISARTSFSLLLPPLIDEFHWSRGLASGAFAFGFLVSAVLSPTVGQVMDRYGPRFLLLAGTCLTALGLFLATLMQEPWQLYVTLGFLVGGGTNLMGFSVHSIFLPNWFVRRRGLALGIAFSGAGVGALVILPWLQEIILRAGWRASCVALGSVVLFVLAPLSFFVWQRPEDLGLEPDGQRAQTEAEAKARVSNVVDHAWVNVEWTIAKAMRTHQFWCIIFGYFCALFAWYAVQVHQTKYLVEVGFSPAMSAWALALVSGVGMFGQIGMGALSDRIGREWAWGASCLGSAISCAALLALEGTPTQWLMYVMVLSQGMLGYGMTSLMGPIVMEMFQGKSFGSIFGVVTIAVMAGGAAGPWVTGVIYDETGSYRVAFALSLACCLLASVAIWIAAPRKVRLVQGRIRSQKS